MSNPFYHAKSSERKFDIAAETTLPLHQWMDQSKSYIADARHRVWLHNSAGIFLCEEAFGLREENKRLKSILKDALEILEGSDLSAHASILKKRIPNVTPITITCDITGKEIPIRLLAEMHVTEDLACIPTLAEIIEKFPKDIALIKRARPLSKELEDAKDV